MWTSIQIKPMLCRQHWFDLDARPHRRAAPGGQTHQSPVLLCAVGSQANVGGAASAPIVASAFSPALAPVGVLLAVLGYAVGTIGAIVCMEWMHALSM